MNSEAATRGVLLKKKSCSQEFRDIHKKTPVFESLLHKVAGLRACNFIKSDCNTYLPVKFAKILRTPFFTEHLWWLHLWCPVANFTKSSIFDFWLGSQCASLAPSFFWNVLNQKSTGSIFQIENHCRLFCFTSFIDCKKRRKNFSTEAIVEVL